MKKGQKAVDEQGGEDVQDPEDEGEEDTEEEDVEGEGEEMQRCSGGS